MCTVHYVLAQLKDIQEQYVAVCPQRGYTFSVSDTIKIYDECIALSVV